MGRGIAQVAAMAGFKTILYDIQASALEEARENITKNLDGAIDRNKIDALQKDDTLARIKYTRDIFHCDGELIVEAIVERLDIKIDIFKKLATINKEDAIFATNTSSIPITQIAAGVPQPERVVGMHFFNPAHIMKLVEVITSEFTCNEVAQCIYQLAIKIGKQPVFCKDQPGFITNRVARHYYVEALKMVEDQIATIEQVDDIMESMGFRMGPFKLMDLVGNDINLAVTQSLYNAFFQVDRFRPSRLQTQKVAAGLLGRKTGKGYYQYDK
ncbi:UNVERIFIED_CONTAM: hypothetical protein GTU68_024732 [Idotea baltica]|nr:hypothetical protein [Idotea baltica]